MGWITSNDEDDSKTMNIWRKVMINSNQTWSEVTSIMNVMMKWQPRVPRRKSLILLSKKYEKIDTKKRRSQKAHIRTLNNKHTRLNDPQISIYTLNDGEYYAHTHIRLFFFYFHFIFFSHFFYIHTNAHTLNINKWTPKMISIKDRHTLKWQGNKNSLWRDDFLKLRISKSVYVW